VKIPTIIMLLLLSTILAACSSNTTMSPTTSQYQSSLATKPVGGINSSDADILIGKHVYNLATTYHGKQVLAFLIDHWGITNEYDNSDGSWVVEYHIDNYEMEGNELMKSVLTYKDKGDDAGYFMVWGVSADGSEITPVNGNAIRVEGELTK
jgi:hypothetical protein